MAENLLFKLAQVDACVYRVPVATPVETAFGIMRERPALFLRVTDDQGNSGVGEVWCNFPNVGAEHRAHLLIDSVAPVAMASRWADPPAMQEALEHRFRILGIQSGEPGPVAQVIAGLDIACWDLVARRAGLPLWRLLGGASPEVAVYASGLNPTNPEVLARHCADAGHRAFKLKVGFGLERDAANLAALRSDLGADAELMVDANQSWDAREAIEHIRRLAAFDLRWVEEPLSAEASLAQWAGLAAQSDVPIAAGENLRGQDAFVAFLNHARLGVVQPDVAKWGGISACMPLGKLVLARGRRLCPHWLGGGVGLIASLHFKSALGGDGRVEIDANANPLREAFLGDLPVKDGAVTLTNEPGLGRVAQMDTLRPFQTLALQASA